MFKKDSWQGMFKLSRTSNYAIWDRDDNKFKTIKHVARWRDIWNNSTKLLLFGRKLHQENPNWEINSDIVELDLPKRINNLKNIIEHFWKRWCFKYVTSLRECQEFKNRKICYFLQKKWSCVIIRRKAAHTKMVATHPAITCWKLRIETLEQSVKYVQS